VTPRPLVAQATMPSTRSTVYVANGRRHELAPVLDAFTVRGFSS
jgi:hypothetical protein